ncbi:MAG: tol-pal system YbgF family protein [Flavobacteriales bacterium]
MRTLIYTMALAVSVAACNSPETSENGATAQTGTPSYDAEYESNKAAKLEQILDLEEQVQAETTGQDIKLRQRLLVSYADYANYHHEEPEVPEFLFRSAKLAVEIGKPRKAIEHLVNLHDGYPKYERRTEAAFMIAFIYESVLNDRIRAEEYYNKVIEFYPESIWAEDAKASLKLLYLTDEEKIKMFMEQNANVK